MDLTVHKDDARPAGRPGECFYCRASMGAEHKPSCVILQLRRFEAVPPFVWHPIDSYEDGFHVAFYWPYGEAGGGGIEAATLFRNDDTWNYWTHGGPNGGSDWEPRNSERPTMWMKIAPPESPS